MQKTTDRPELGYGLGLRPVHFPDILNGTPNVDWFEILSENFMVDGGPAMANMMAVRERFPLVMHGVSLSIGAPEPLNEDYLSRLKQLADRVEPAWISDHLCWTGAHGLNMHDLLPLPYTEEAANHVASRVGQVQDRLGRRILLENASSYVTFLDSEMSEWQFLSLIAERADCLILLDINNIYVSAFNHGFDAGDYLAGVPVERVWQFHLAGHENNGDYIVDTHDHPVIDDVWALYERAVQRFGAVSTMIERDAHIPPLADLIAELDQARAIGEKVLGR